MIVTTELTILRSSWWKLWPCFVAAFCGPLLGTLLARWLPFHFAIGLASFVAWFFAGLMLAKKFTPRWELPGWLAGVLMGRHRPLRHSIIVFLPLEIDRVNCFLS